MRIHFVCTSTIENCSFVMQVSGPRVTLVANTADSGKVADALSACRARDGSAPKFLIGRSGGKQIAVYNGLASFSDEQIALIRAGLCKTIEFSAPLVVQQGCGEKAESSEFGTFQAVRFHGGSINALFPPREAYAGTRTLPDGSLCLELKPKDSFSLSTSLTLSENAAPAAFTVSVFYAPERDASMDGAFPLGELNACLELSFQQPQPLDTLPHCMELVRDLVALLCGQRNVRFHTQLCHIDETGCVPTADCILFDTSDPCAVCDQTQVIPIRSVMDVLPNLIRSIESGEAKPLLHLLPEDSRDRLGVSAAKLRRAFAAFEDAACWLVDTPSQNVGAAERLSAPLAKHCEMLQRCTGTETPLPDADTIHRLTSLQGSIADTGIALSREAEELYRALVALLCFGFLRHIGVSEDEIPTLLKPYLDRA